MKTIKKKNAGGKASINSCLIVFSILLMKMTLPLVCSIAKNLYIVCTKKRSLFDEAPKFSGVVELRGVEPLTS